MGSPLARVWLLNLDAEAELLRPGNVNPSHSAVERCRALAATAIGVVPSGDLSFVVGDPPPRLPRGARGHAWCPTPSARRILAAARAIVPEGPSWELLRAVNHRSFAASIAQPLPGAVFTRDEGVVRERIGGGGRWLLKRPLSYRGNGRLRVIDPSDPRALAWVRTSLCGGDGLQVEPEVARTDDFGQHGHLSRAGALTWGALTRQRVDAFGQWCATERCEGDPLTLDERRAHDDTRARVAEALRARGYHGPFGIDAFRWRDEAGRLRYNALCEVNARYSMGWAVGMGDARPDLEEEHD